MKVIAINGSPNAKGNTYHSLELVAAPLREQGIEVEIVHIGNKTIRGCLGCGSCRKKQNEQCVLNDGVNEVVRKVKEADGLLLGTPVHFSGVGGTMKSFLDRLFYVSGSNGNLFRHKVGAAVVAVRRSGGVSTFDELNHYLHFAEMLIPTSNYWSVIHGREAGEVLRDEEGVQIMTVLGENMAWLMKLVESGKEKVAEPPKSEKRYMNFIR